MLDEVGIIHMNGRIYDPRMGRFLQADPIVQDPTNSQSLNRYSYTWNNPLNATDPSGYSNWLFDVFRIIVNGFANPTAAIFYNSVRAGGDPFSAFQAALASTAFSGIAGTFESAGLLGNSAFLNKTFGYGVAGGVTSIMQGGQFGHGFRNAGASGAVSLGIAQVFSGVRSTTARTTVGAIAGGTSSVLSGGKFANGALYAASSQVLNIEQEENRKAKATPKLTYSLSENKLIVSLTVDGETMTVEMTAFAGAKNHTTWGNSDPLPVGEWRIVERPDGNRNYFALFKMDGEGLVNDQFIENGVWRDGMRLGFHTSQGSHGCIMTCPTNLYDIRSVGRAQAQWDTIQDWVRQGPSFQLTYQNNQNPAIMDPTIYKIRAYGTLTVTK